MEALSTRKAALEPSGEIASPDRSATSTSIRGVGVGVVCAWLLPEVATRSAAAKQLRSTNSIGVLLRIRVRYLSGPSAFVSTRGRDQNRLRRLRLITRPSARSEEPTSELQSLMRTSYAVF